MQEDIPRYVYVIGVTGMQAVKIGAAFDCNLRMANLQIGCPLLMTLLWKKSSDNALGMEKALHAHFADRRIRGEWFNLGLDPVPQIESAFSQEKPALPPPRILTPNQQLIQAIGVILDTVFADREFINGLDLSDELRRIDNRLFDKSPVSMGHMIVSAVRLPLELVKINEVKMKGYWAKDLRVLVRELRL